MNREKFLSKALEEFPESFNKLDDFSKGLLHCEMEEFLRYVLNKMDNGFAWECEKAFRFIESSLLHADSELSNAIEISFIEGLALNTHTSERYIIVKERATKILRMKIIENHEFWK